MSESYDGPELAAHIMRLQAENKRLTVERDELAQEVHYLRLYGNKDATSMADEALGLLQEAVVKLKASASIRGSEGYAKNLIPRCEAVLKDSYHEWDIWAMAYRGERG